MCTDNDMYGLLYLGHLVEDQGTGVHTTHNMARCHVSHADGLNPMATTCTLTCFCYEALCDVIMVAMPNQNWDLCEVTVNAPADDWRIRGVYPQ